MSTMFGRRKRELRALRKQIAADRYRVDPHAVADAILRGDRPSSALVSPRSSSRRDQLRLAA
jgi:hypothetical protein